jgi:hypothetical protein
VNTASYLKYPWSNRVQWLVDPINHMPIWQHSFRYGLGIVLFPVDSSEIIIAEVLTRDYTQEPRIRDLTPFTTVRVFDTETRIPNSTVVSCTEFVKGEFTRRERKRILHCIAEEREKRVSLPSVFTTQDREAKVGKGRQIKWEF